MELMAAEARIAELESALNEARQAAFTDALTGALNRRGFDEAYQRELARSRRNGSSLAIALIDLDDFKRLNDTMGHQAGDDALRVSGLGQAGFYGVELFDDQGITKADVDDLVAHHPNVANAIRTLYEAWGTARDQARTLASGDVVGRSVLPSGLARRITFSNSSTEDSRPRAVMVYTIS